MLSPSERRASRWRQAYRIYIRPGIYEDKVFVSDRPVWLIGAGHDRVQIYCRRGGPLYLQRVFGGRIAGITFRYVRSEQHAAMNGLDATCVISHCRAMEGILSGVILYGPECRVRLSENDVCRNRESGIFVFVGALLVDNVCRDNQHWGIVMIPDTHPNTSPSELPSMNQLASNPRGDYTITDEPLPYIGR